MNAYYTVRQVAEMMQVTTQAVGRWIKDGHLKAFRVNPRGHWRIDREEFSRFLAEQRTWEKQ